MADADSATAGSADGHVMIFAPLPMLTVTVEDRGNGLDIHLHAGGQGVWQARMVAALDTRVTLLNPLCEREPSGAPGDLAQALESAVLGAG